MWFCLCTFLGRQHDSFSFYSIPRDAILHIIFHSGRYLVSKVENFFLFCTHNQLPAKAINPFLINFRGRITTFSYLLPHRVKLKANESKEGEKRFKPEHTCKSKDEKVVNILTFTIGLNNLFSCPPHLWIDIIWTWVNLKSFVKSRPKKARCCALTNLKRCVLFSRSHLLCWISYPDCTNLDLGVFSLHYNQDLASLFGITPKKRSKQQLHTLIIIISWEVFPQILFNLFMLFSSPSNTWVGL